MRAAFSCIIIDNNITKALLGRVMSYSLFEGYYQHGNSSSDRISIKGELGFKARTRGWGEGVVAGRGK